jgi:signal peptidase II
MKSLGNLRWMLLSILVIILDQLSKWLALQHLTAYQSKGVIPFLNFTLMFNRGAAFSFLSEKSQASWLFGIVAIVVSVLIFIWLIRLPRSRNLLAAGLSLVLGGAISNLIDRVHYRFVVDFIDFYVGTWHWPAFNLADSAIVCGVILLLLDAFIKPMIATKEKA